MQRHPEHTPRLSVVKRDGRQICPDCGGNGRHAVDESARATALGVTLAVYRRYWAVHFQSMLAVLDHVDGSVVDTMRRQLRQ